MSEFFDTPLSDVITIQNDKKAQLKTSEYQSTGILSIIDQSSKFICGYTDDVSKKYSKCLPVIVFGDHTLNTKYIDFNFALGADGTQVIKTQNPHHEHKYLYYVISREILIMGSEGYKRHLKILKERVVPFSKNVPEQKKIASILTSVDEVIEKTQSQIDKLQDLKKATMNELLTKGIGHTEFKDSALGRIPKSWEVKPLAKVCEVSSSKRVMQSDYVDEGVPFYRSKEIILKSKGEKVQSVLYIPEEQFLNLASKFDAPARGDILITAVGTIGVCYLVGQEKFYFKDGNLLWLKKINKLIPSFLLVFLSNQNTRERIIEISGGSSQSALTIEKLSDFLVPIPSQYEQDKFSKIAKSLDERINSQKQKLSQTQSLKKSLMQDLLTGKVRVSIE